MKRRLCILFIFMFTFSLVAFHGKTSLAQEDVADLKAKIQALEKKVEELEKANEKQQQDRDYNPGRPRSWDPFYEIEQMQEQMNQMFQNSFGRSGLNRGIFKNDMSFGYDYDIKEKENGYEIIFDMTDLDKNNVDIEIKNNSITVKGQYSSEQSEENPSSILKTKSYGSFLKMIPVPLDADTAKAKTEKRGDTLIITLPKKI